MTEQAKLVFLADRILDDRRMIPRAYDLLERIAADAEAFAEGKHNRPKDLACAWGRLIRAAIAFCERLATRVDGVVLEEDFAEIDLRDVVFRVDDMATLKIFARKPKYAAVARSALDIVRQCRHIQALVHSESLSLAA